MMMINQQILNFLKNKWKTEFVKKKAKWDKDPEYTLLPKDIGLTSDCWDQGFMESIQSDIKKDLKEYGAYDIYNFGFID